MTPLPLIPQAPTAAYWAVAKLLWDDAFLAPIPSEGLHVYVECTDGSESHWFLPEETGRIVLDHLAEDDDVEFTSGVLFNCGERG